MGWLLNTSLIGAATTSASAPPAATTSIYIALIGLAGAALGAVALVYTSRQRAESAAKKAVPIPAPVDQSMEDVYRRLALLEDDKDQRDDQDVKDLYRRMNTVERRQSRSEERDDEQDNRLDRVHGRIDNFERRLDRS